MATPLLRNLPSVNELLESAPLKAVSEKLNRSVVVGNVRSFLDNLRNEVQRSAAEIKLPTGAELAERIAQWILTREEQGVQPAINATGALLHPHMELPLAAAAAAQVQEVAVGYTTLAHGEPAARHSGQGEAESLLRELTGAEAALVLNQPAGALLLALATLAAGKEVIVARGELADQGDGCRVPDLIAAAGALLRETGASNRTTPADFASAVRPETACIARFHPLQHALVGDAQSATLAEVVTAARRRHLPVLVDLGNGGIRPVKECDSLGETNAAAAISAGADLVIVRGNRLLGGPACGILLGRQHLLDRLAAHPLAAALLPGRLTQAALAATLRLYTDDATVTQHLPILSLLSGSVENLQNRAARLAPQLAATGCCATAEAIETTAWLTGEPLPAHRLASWGVAITPAHGDAPLLARRLAAATPPVVPRVEGERLVIDLRSVLPRQDAEIASLLQRIDAEPADTSPTDGHRGMPAGEESQVEPDADPRNHDVGQ